MSEKPRSRHKVNLLTGEASYPNPYSQDPRTARRVLGFIPSLAGDLARELVNPTYNADAAFSSAVRWLAEFAFKDNNGNLSRRVFSEAGGVLRQSTPPTGAWSLVSNAPTFVRAPMGAAINNQFHISDGASQTVFDALGLFTPGLPLPNKPAAITTTAGSGTPAIIATNRYYWTTFADETTGDGFDRTHQSTSSPISAASGVVNNTGNVSVRQRAGTISTSTASAVVTGVGTDFNASDVGRKLYTAGQLQGTIASFISATEITLTANAATTTGGVNFVIAPSRATHWYLYASVSDNSRVGILLARTPVTTVVYTDTSPFPGQTGSAYDPALIERPLENDPPLVSRILVRHKSRLWRVRETNRAFVNFSANEEVDPLQGAPAECVPGTDAATISRLINEFSYPDESDAVRGMISHGDALHIGTEDELQPCYGSANSLEGSDFALSQVTSFSVGVGGRFALISTPHGLPFVSYDHKVYLYPSTGPVGVQNETSALVELSRPIRQKLEALDPADIDNVRLVFYNWGRRNWLVLCFKDTSGVYHTWVYDFEIQGWSERTRGVVSLDVWEIAEGKRVLVGGGTDGKVYILDDLTGTYTGSGNHPACTFRSPLIQAPDGSSVIFRYLEFHLSNEALAPDITVTYWLDPIDVDNPGAGITLAMTRISDGQYRGFPVGGGLCDNILVEIGLAASTNVGTIRQIELTADPVSRLSK